MIGDNLHNDLDGMDEIHAKMEKDQQDEIEKARNQLIQEGAEMEMLSNNPRFKKLMKYINVKIKDIERDEINSIRFPSKKTNEQKRTDSDRRGGWLCGLGHIQEIIEEAISTKNSIKEDIKKEQQDSQEPEGGDLG